MNSINKFRAEPIGIVCHDAGGANQVISFIKRNPQYKFIPYMQGPAIRIWESEFPAIKMSESLEHLIDASSLLISGTGWASNLEHEARKLARQKLIYSITLLDHWTAFYNRFIYDNELILPDEIWVVDKYALKIAKDVFKSTRLKLISDYFSLDQLEKITPIHLVQKDSLLYLLEPTASCWGNELPGEFQALEYFFGVIDKLKLPKSVKIYLRPHPSESFDKYFKYTGPASGYEVVLDNGSLSEAISRSYWVVGCQTYAMTLALLANRRVYCSLPPWAERCNLPHEGLIFIKDM